MFCKFDFILRWKRNGGSPLKQIELFYLTHCPYCINARRAIEELKSENSAYEEIRIHWI